MHVLVDVTHPVWINISIYLTFFNSNIYFYKIIIIKLDKKFQIIINYKTSIFVLVINVLNYVLFS